MAKKDEEILAQLEAIRKEIKEGKEQASGALAMEPEGGILRTRTKSLKRFKWISLLIIFVFIGGIVGAGAYKILGGGEPAVEKGSFLEQMKELSSLASSQALVKAVIEKEDNQLFGKEIVTNIPGTKRKLLLVVPGTVTAGVDLQNLDENHVKMNEEEKTLEVTLPHASILQEPSLNFEEVQAFSVEGIFREEVNWEEAYDLASEAKTLVEEEAVKQGLLQMAEKNAEKTLKQFFSQMGYEVTIHYED